MTELSREAPTCPPCNGHCRQGRDCPADADRPPLTPDERRQRAIVCRVILVACGAFWAMVAWGVTRCTS